MTILWVYIKGMYRPAISARLVKRGRHKGRYEITLTNKKKCVAVKIIRSNEVYYKGIK